MRHTISCCLPASGEFGRCAAYPEPAPQLGGERGDEARVFVSGADNERRAIGC